MNNEFNREERYIVFKVSDLGNSLKGDEIRKLAREYAEQRLLKGKKPLECVVVEKDWPEYEPMWKAIEARVTGTPDESAIQTAARILNINLILERNALRDKIEEMEKQEPVGTAFLCVQCKTPFDGEHFCPKCGHHTATEENVYALPCAQTLPSVSAELLDRAIDTIGRFCSDEGWMQSDMDTLDALIAASEAKP